MRFFRYLQSGTGLTLQKLPMLAICTVAIIGVLFFATRPMAGRVVVDDLEVVQDRGCSTITVTFNFPVQYIKHFPYESGEDLRIQLDPIVTGTEEGNALYTRETVQLPPNGTGALVDVAYEGHVDGGPYLTLFFQTPVKFNVAQGKDFRSLVVAVSVIDANSPCETLPR